MLFRLKKVIFIMVYCFLCQQNMIPVSYAVANVSKSDSLGGGRYVISQGETLSSIARQYGISTHILLTMNTDAIGDSNEIQVGQVINVPSGNNLPSLQYHNEISVSSNSEKPLDAKIAEQASRLGKAFTSANATSSVFLNSNSNDVVSGAQERQVYLVNLAGASSANGTAHHSSKDEIEYWQREVTSKLEKEASNKTNEYVSALLGGNGTVKSEIKVDSEFNIDSASLDALLPLNEDETHVTFAQGGIRRNDGDRTIANIGVGQRHFLSDVMLGYNAFYDHDLTRNHSRIGLGGEAWADNFKFSSNLYNPLSSWKDSEDFVDHEERASRGFDLRAKAYLPAYPQLGGNITLEKYFGDKVDIMGNKQLESSPQAITVGVEYTPFPLISLKASHTNTSGGQDDTNLFANFEWKFGATWEQMLNPKNIDRSLQGLHLDLVERNNDIVLEYREKDMLNVSIQELYQAKELGVLTLALQLKNTDGIANITWLGDVLTKSGLTEAQLSGVNAYSVTIPTLPAYNVNGDNKYPVKVIVRDKAGRERIVSTTIEVMEDKNIVPKIILSNQEVTLQPGESYVINWKLFDPRQGVLLSGHPHVVANKEKSARTTQDEQINSGVNFSYRYLKGDGDDDVMFQDTNTILVSDDAKNADHWINVLADTPSGHQATAKLKVIVLAANLTAAPVVDVTNITGTLQVGQTLTGVYSFNANGGEQTDASTMQWLNGSHTDTDTQYVLDAGDVGQVLTYEVTAKNGADVVGNTDSMDTASLILAGNIQVSGVTVVDNGGAPVAENPLVGTQLNSLVLLEGEVSAAVNRATAPDGRAFTYQWKRTPVGQSSWVNISGATLPSYIAKEKDQGYLIAVDVTQAP